MSLRIDLNNDGEMTISIDGIVVGLIHSVELHADLERHPVAHVYVSMVDIKRLAPNAQKAHLQRVLVNNKKLLSSHPLIRVSDAHDTLPQGMPAVLPEDEEGSS